VRVITDPRILTKEEAEHYWDRLRISGKEKAEEETSKSVLIIEDGKKPCKVGFGVDLNNRCPLLVDDFGPDKLPDLRRMTEVLRRVLQERIGPKSWPK
jgi:hypothetical protein